MRADPTTLLRHHFLPGAIYQEDAPRRDERDEAGSGVRICDEKEGADDDRDFGHEAEGQVGQRREEGGEDYFHDGRDLLLGCDFFSSQTDTQIRK